MSRGVNFKPCFSRHVRGIYWAALALIFLAAPPCGGQSPAPAVTPSAVLLEKGKPIEGEIAGSVKHTFELDLSQHEYAKVTIEQKGIDIVARLSDPAGKLISEFDLDVTTRGSETAEVCASVTGRYRLEIEGRPRKAAAGRYAIDLAELRASGDRDRSLQDARNLLAESSSFTRAGKHQDALRAAERALQIREQVLGTDHASVALVINLIGLIYTDMGDMAGAEKFFDRALAIYGRSSGANSLDAAVPLNNLAVVYKVRGDFVEAENTYERVLAIRERELGQRHNLVAAVYNNLGVLYRARGDNAASRKMYERALEIREQLFGPDSLEIAPVLTNLSLLNYYGGDYAAALKLGQRVLEIREKSLGPDNNSVVNSLDNLGLFYAGGGDPEKALAAYQRAMDILEKLKAVESVNGANILNNLAEIYTRRGELARAEPLLKRALDIAEKRSATEVGSLTLYLTNLGRLYIKKGDHAAAESILRRALEIRERTLPDGHLDLGRTFDALAFLYLSKGDLRQALSFQQRANLIYEKNIGLNLAIGTEQQKLSYLSLMSENLDQTISLHTRMAAEPEALELAFASVLQRKGRVLDAMTDSFAGLRRRSDPKDEILFVRLNDANAQLAELTLSPSQSASLADRQKRISEIIEQKDRLEAEIGRRSEGFYVPSQPITLAAVKRQIPADAALVEFAVYYPTSTGSNGPSQPAQPRYVVYVTGNAGVPKWTELGPVKDIDPLVESFRRSLRDPKRTDVGPVARALDTKIMQPVRTLIGDARHLLLSPEGELNLIPFEALVDEQGRHLIQNYSFTYLTSGRDLLRMGAARASKGGPMVVADPAFGEPPPQQSDKAGESPRSQRVRNKSRRGITAARDLSGTYFSPLPGTAQEALAIRSIFPGGTFLMAGQATESALRNAAAPEILHIATHGFFLENGVNTLSRNGSSTAGGTRIENPLLRSGLALAGANKHGGGADDGILTALEASGLNLWGTKLVVLSACDTGVGEIRNGEGVYGLRRSFVLSGAESLIMSLWPVSDATTRELMSNYYKNLKQAMGRGAALRQVQLEILKRPGRQHPFYWASFIHFGEWANLDGKR